MKIELLLFTLLYEFILMYGLTEKLSLATATSEQTLFNKFQAALFLHYTTLLLRGQPRRNN